MPAESRPSLPSPIPPEGGQSPAKPDATAQGLPLVDPRGLRTTSTSAADASPLSPYVVREISTNPSKRDRDPVAAAKQQATLESLQQLVKSRKSEPPPEIPKYEDMPDWHGEALKTKIKIGDKTTTVTGTRWVNHKTMQVEGVATIDGVTQPISSDTMENLFGFAFRFEGTGSSDSPHVANAPDAQSNTRAFTPSEPTDRSLSAVPARSDPPHNHAIRANVGETQEDQPSQFTKEEWTSFKDGVEDQLRRGTFTQAGRERITDLILDLRSIRHPLTPEEREQQREQAAQVLDWAQQAGSRSLPLDPYTGLRNARQLGPDAAELFAQLYPMFNRLYSRNNPTVAEKMTPAFWDLPLAQQQEILASDPSREEFKKFFGSVTEDGERWPPRES